MKARKLRKNAPWNEQTTVTSRLCLTFHANRLLHISDRDCSRDSLTILVEEIRAKLSLREIQRRLQRTRCDSIYCVFKYLSCEYITNNHSNRMQQHVREPNIWQGQISDNYKIIWSVFSRFGLLGIASNFRSNKKTGRATTKWVDESAIIHKLF